MSAQTLVSLEEYLSTSYRPDCEYLDGSLLERNLGEYDHSRLQALLCGYLLNREKPWRIRAVPEQRVQVTRTRFRVPDVSVVHADGPIEQIFRTPPLLCVEILSKDDTMSEMQERVDDYLDMGVPCVWVIDPRRKIAVIYARDSIREVRQGSLTVPDSPVSVPLDSIFE